MGKQSYSKDSSGRVVEIRETSNDGRQSVVYKADQGLPSAILGPLKGDAVRVEDHHSNGTTRAYEADTGLFSRIFSPWGAMKGSPKNSAESSQTSAPSGAGGFGGDEFGFAGFDYDDGYDDGYEGYVYEPDANLDDDPEYFDGYVDGWNTHYQEGIRDGLRNFLSASQDSPYIHGYHKGEQWFGELSHPIKDRRRIRVIPREFSACVDCPSKYCNSCQYQNPCGDCNTDDCDGRECNDPCAYCDGGDCHGCQFYNPPDDHTIQQSRNSTGSTRRW